MKADKIALRVQRMILWLPNQISMKIDPTGFAKRQGVKIHGKVSFYGKPNLSTEPWLISLGDNVHITKNVQFITHDGGVLILRKTQKDLEISKPIKVGNDVYIGINSILLPGVTVGNRVIIAAGSVVTRDIPDNSVVGGVPARFIKTVDAYFEKSQRESLHIGHLSAYAKAAKLKEIYKDFQ